VCFNGKNDGVGWGTSKALSPGFLNWFLSGGEENFSYPMTGGDWAS
jgi:hypothetical protein